MATFLTDLNTNIQTNLLNLVKCFNSKNLKGKKINIEVQKNEIDERYIETVYTVTFGRNNRVIEVSELNRKSDESLFKINALNISENESFGMKWFDSNCKVISKAYQQLRALYSRCGDA